MASDCPTISLRSNDYNANTTQLILAQRWQDSPKDDRQRLEKCWGYTDCGDCHRSEGFCGWCAIVSSLNYLYNLLA
ncbi:hypothetical protein BU24DRAFT_416971 [Aaosphaeria arxii CBS 175.79]|uniref:Uncharacterized protein n=1 Tax=Aaosphaeria arxii CBS 175.79 TaxID=1450172 RepID=A0A6A5Y926_9PLEO|nr:uncharacterized protein BU24DRAFT_416971 [Aaosphaeria arxii CBS 175.79]KAF2021310.1 hypothetical protein BU24DRAFT_416971 [Aaosphaeria arxii CBS 175.79]